jgi:hypothetical protein
LVRVCRVARNRTHGDRDIGMHIACLTACTCRINAG